MKKIKHILALVALLVGGVSCTILQEDAFSTDPVAPEFLAHGDILMTENTMDEDVNFTWTAYRFLPEGLNYTLKATYIEDTKVLLTLPQTIYKTTKTDFKNLLYTTFPTLPVNDTFVLSFQVSVTDDNGKEYASNAMGVTIYAYGDAIAPVITPAQEELVLDPARAMEEVALLSWEPARLVYGEKVKYNVYLSTVTEAMMATRALERGEVLLAEGLTKTSFSMTVDALNEAVIAAGGAEAAAVPVKFLVEAFCDSMPEGIKADAGMTVTTFVATFAEVLYLPGNYQGWTPSTAPTLKLSGSVKGYYEGIVDLTNQDGGNTQFKFCPEPDWGNDFGGAVTIGGKEGVYVLADGTVGANTNIEVPSDIYLIQLNKKLNKLRMISIKSLGAIGTAFGSRDQEVPMEWDKENNVFTVTADIVPGEYKFRLNNDWDFSIDNSNGVNGGGSNYETSLSGNYKVTVDMGSHPYTVKFTNTSFPEKLYVPGSHNGWDHTATVLTGDGEGHYEGFAKIGGEWGFKLTSLPCWKDDGATVWGRNDDVAVVTDDVTGTIIFGIMEDGGNIEEGTTTAYSYIRVDLENLEVRTVPVNTLGIIGGFNGWSEDYATFTYDEQNNVWTASRVEIQKGIEWKIRSNQSWDNDDFFRANLGFGEDKSFDNLVEHGGNMSVAESGIYDLTLSIATRPFKLTLTKVGESPDPELPEEMFMVGEGIVDWSTFLPMTPFHSQAGMFWAIRYIEAGKGFKFAPEAGWGKDFCQLDTNEGFTVDGGNCYVSETGIYCIGIDMDGSRLIVEPAKVYGIGTAWDGDWIPADADNLFTVDGTTLVGTASSDGTVRTFVHSALLPSVDNWWHAEFVPLNGEISYRATGGDPADVPVTAGQKIIYDFNAGTGVIE